MSRLNVEAFLRANQFAGLGRALEKGVHHRSPHFHAQCRIDLSEVFLMNRLNLDAFCP